MLTWLFALVRCMFVHLPILHLHPEPEGLRHLPGGYMQLGYEADDGKKHDGTGKKVTTDKKATSSDKDSCCNFRGCSLL